MKKYPQLVDIDDNDKSLGLNETRAEDLDIVFREKIKLEGKIFYDIKSFYRSLYNIISFFFFFI